MSVVPTKKELASYAASIRDLGLAGFAFALAWEGSVSGIVQAGLIVAGIGGVLKTAMRIAGWNQ